jgi:1-deoxy-D-xylulose-5-phosphate reductoisomerase
MVEMAADPEVDLVVAATGGTAGLRPALAALGAGKRVALANKEALVMAGALLVEAGSRSGGELVPIDSEHSAIWQCLQGEPERAVERLTLTASGGALRHLPMEALQQVTPAQALRHPTWSMGRKITIDSANLLNKGLEVLEAQWLFNVGAERIDVVQHAESIVHSLVTFEDGSTKAQLGIPDMRVPIQYALSHPERWGNDLPRLDLAQAGSLSFAPIDLERYPALQLAREAGRRGETYPAVLVGADEVAVESFLTGKIGFTDIPRLIEDTMDRHQPTQDPGLDGILDADRWARGMAESLVSARSGRYH